MDKFIQFELWKDCKQGCKFCCNKGARPTNKAHSFKYIQKVLNSLQPNEYDSIGLIGGELFNGEMDLYMHQFYNVMSRIKDLNPKNIYIATSLIYNMRDYLIPTMKAIEDVLGITDKITLCTSWDPMYRFHNEEQKKLWAKNMFALHKHMPQIKVHTEIILTQHFIDLVLKGGWDLDMFQKVFYTTVDFIEPSSGLFYTDKHECQADIPGFFPTKSSFIEFIKAIRDKYDINRLCSPELRADELHFIDGIEHRVSRDRRANGCVEHASDPSKKYDIGFIDSDKTMREIVLQVSELLEV